MSTLIVPLVQIISIEKHPNADTLSIAKFKGFGWQSIIKTGQYEVGDWVIFVPPDAVMPDWIIADQEITYLKGKNKRVGAIRLRGTVSEGVVLPADILDKNPYREMGQGNPTLGEDASGYLGITKYEPPEPVYANRAKSARIRPYNNRTFPVYTDIQHLKNFPDAFSDGELIIVTEKIHGTNFRVGYARKQHKSVWDWIATFFGKYNPYYFTCGSHKVEMGLDKPHATWYDRSNIQREAFEYNLYQKWGQYWREYIPYGYIFYGEIYGASVQDLTYGLKNGKTKVVFYDASHDGVYLSYIDLISIKPRNADLVPVLYTGEYSPGVIERLTNGRSPLALENGVDQIREGVVVRPLHERVDPVYGRVVYKSVSPEYLNRKGGTEYK